AGRSEEAEAAEIMLLPGVGFDVVPSDCLARFVAGRADASSSVRRSRSGSERDVTRVGWFRAVPNASNLAASRPASISSRPRSSASCAIRRPV
ncbi:MAG: hypothetical protein BRD42_09545, partial [Bacteroidetes bacterium QS_3_64_15]